MITRASRQLANELAAIASDIRAQHGDLIAQTAVYGSILDRWEGSAAIPSDRLAGSGWQARIAQALDSADLESVARQFWASGKRPGIYFYEEFLQAYDPQASRSRGVHYSPPEVVSCIVRGVDSLLRTHFGQQLADALVLDPCCGIGTFLKHIEEHVSPRPMLIGMELSEAACELASSLLDDARVLRTDSLSDPDIHTGGRTLVILGNPPYSGHSANPGSIAHLLADYRDGLRERNPKWLQDDYVKFIRMAQHRVDAAGRGIVAFITNHSYLTNPTFRAMRASLMRSFDNIYVLDLHGNARRSDRSLDTACDENVFPIQMGVAISFFVKTSGESDCRVHYAEITGTRGHKLKLLSEMDFAATPWREVCPIKPFSVLVPRDVDLEEQYLAFPSILDFFEHASVGFVTSRDAFAVDFERDSLLERIAALRDESISPDDIRARYPVDDLDILAARKMLREDLFWEDAAVPVLYRPFDFRWAYLSPAVMERPRLPFMHSLLRNNIAIAVGRAGRATGSSTWDVVFCADRPTDLNLFRRGGALVLPRYRPVGPGFEIPDQQGRRLSNVRCASTEHDTMFRYVYAILHSTIYRTRYSDFLAIDFPRIPPIADPTIIEHLAALGQRLLDIHTMRSAPTAGHAAAPPQPFTIGGYPIPEKWLYHRRGSQLTEQDLRHVETIRTAVAETIAIQKQIDEALNKVFRELVPETPCSSRNTLF